MKFRPAQWMMLVTAALLLGAIGLIIYGNSQPLEQKFHDKVKDLLPQQTADAGWQVDNQAIAATPEMQQAVSELLNYDDAVFVNYTKGALRVSIYIAYWKPGKMPHRLVASHTPDVCWIVAGWERVDGRTVPDLPSPQGQLLPGELRTMRHGGVTEHVIFWHLVGGQRVSYETGWRPPWHAMLTDLYARKLRQREEQFFIRISSNQPLEAFWPTELVQKFAGGIPGLGAGT